MADKMTEENYRFKPTPEMQDFGQRMAHVINFNMRGCAAVKGETKPLMFSAAPTKLRSWRDARRPTPIATACSTR